jgi:hypothetical protein
MQQAAAAEALEGAAAPAGRKQASSAVQGIHDVSGYLDSQWLRLSVADCVCCFQN